MSLRFDRPVIARIPVSAAMLAALVLSPVVAGCGGEDRPPKPTCRAGQHAEWDDDDQEWECERDGGGGFGGSSKTRRR